MKEVAADFVKVRRPSSIVQRPGTVEEFDNFLVYVASPLFSATTGAALHVDGGVVDMIA
ncbi:MAG: SDR family oxidoreductase [Methylocystis sp.]